MPKDRQNITRRAYFFNVDPNLSPSLCLENNVKGILEMVRFNVAEDMFFKDILCKAWSIAEIDLKYFEPPPLNFGLGQKKPYVHVMATVEILDEQKASVPQGTN